MSEVSVKPVVNYVGCHSQGGWSDGSTARVQMQDASRPGIYRTVLDMFYEGEPLDTFAVDLLQARSRAEFTVAMGAVNGTAPVVWDRRLGAFYRALRAQQAQTPAAPTPPPPRQKAVRLTAREILATQPAPLTYVVEDILPAGCTLFTGKSKDGKSLAAYDLAVAVASGGKAFGRYDVTQGSVWYLALEDGHRRAYDRLTLMQQRAETSLPDAALDKLAFTL